MKTDDQEHWLSHVVALAASGDSRAAYCRNHGLDYSRMVRWQRLHGKGTRPTRKPRAFVKATGVAVAAPLPAPAGVRVAVGNAVIELPASAHPRWIAELALAIGGLGQ